MVACRYQKNMAETNIFTTRKAAKDIIQGSIFVPKIKFITTTRICFLCEN